MSGKAWDGLNRLYQRAIHSRILIYNKDLFGFRFVTCALSVPIPRSQRYISEHTVTQCRSFTFSRTICCSQHPYLKLEKRTRSLFVFARGMPYVYVVGDWELLSRAFYQPHSTAPDRATVYHTAPLRPPLVFPCISCWARIYLLSPLPRAAIRIFVNSVLFDCIPFLRH